MPPSTDFRAYVVVHYRFNEASGNAVDAATYALHLTQNGTVGSAAGKIDGARTFSGNTSNWFERASQTEIQTGIGVSFSWCGWVKFNSVAANQAIVNKYDNDSTTSEFFIKFVSSTNSIVFSPAIGIESSASGFTTGVWYFVAVTYDSVAVKSNISINGAAFTTTGFTGSTQNTILPLRFGVAVATSTRVEPLDGALDSWTFIKGYALTDDDVAVLYNGGGGLDYPFDATVQPPLLRQRSQRQDPLPDFNFRVYQQRADWAVPQEYIPTPPPSRQASQRTYQLPDFDYRVYQQSRRWPVPVEFIPPPPPPRPRSQWTYQLPNFDYSAWEQFRRHPLPTGVMTAYVGLGGIYVGVTGGEAVGASRVRNDIEGYNVYVGVDALPDLSAAPAAFTQTLPFNVVTTPPVSGTKTYNVIVRRQDEFGLESQNQTLYTTTINSSGDLVMPAIVRPQGLQLTPQAGGRIRVLSTYPGYGVDGAFTATHWRVWASLGAIDVDADPPTLVVTMTGKVLATSVGPLPAGDYTVAVALYRTTNGTRSPAISGTVTLPEDPEEIIPVPGGYEDP